MSKFLWALFLSGCGLVTIKKNYETVVERGVDSAFFEYVKNFEILSETKVHGHIAMWFNVETTEGKAGECDPSTREIRVNWDEWNATSNAEHENMIFHELGHCLLNRSHNEGLSTIEGIPQAPISLMHSKLIEPSLYKKLRGYYHEELFGRRLPNSSYTSQAFP